MRGFVLLAGIAACILCVAGVNPTTLLRVYNITLPAEMSESYWNFRVQGWDELTPRLYNAPLPGGDLLVGWNDASDVGRVSYLKKDVEKGYVLKKTVTISGRQVRGLAALNDTSFGVLAWVYSSTATSTKMYVQKWTKMSASGTPTKSFEKELTNTDSHPTDFEIGDSRLEIDANGDFYAYYHVHSTDGHEGDTYFSVNSKSGKVTRIWAWGCSHSMSNLLSYHPVLNKTVSICVTDCYPGTSGDFATNSIGGIYTENSNKIQTMAGGCDGCVGGELGMVAPIYSGGWALIFNSHRSSVGKGQAACQSSYNQDIGFVVIGKDKKLGTSTVWLTKTSQNEVDPGLARYGKFVASQTFLVGWKRGNDRFLATVNRTGGITAGPYNATVVKYDGKTYPVSWGSRDDTWRTLSDGSVAWLEAPETQKKQLRVYVVYYGSVPTPPTPSSSSSSSVKPPPTPIPSSSSSSSSVKPPPTPVPSSSSSSSSVKPPPTPTPSSSSSVKPISSLTPPGISSDSNSEESSANSSSTIFIEGGFNRKPFGTFIVSIIVLFVLALF